MAMSAVFETAAAQIVDAGRRLDARGWAMAGSGNYSMRLEDGSIAITVSGRHKGRLTPEDVMRVDADARSLDSRRPSAEAALHAAVYRARPWAVAVLHTHSVPAVSLSMASTGRWIEISGVEMLKALPGFETHEDEAAFPVFANDQDMKRLSARVERELAEEPRTPAFLLRGHGLYAWGETMEQAICAAEGAEHLLACELEISRLNQGGAA